MIYVAFSFNLHSQLYGLYEPYPSLEEDRHNLPGLIESVSLASDHKYESGKAVLKTLKLPLTRRMQPNLISGAGDYCRPITNSLNATLHTR